MFVSDYELAVRYVECDPLGIAHHSNYFAWFELARTQMLKDAGLSYVLMMEQGAFAVVADIGARFRAPARYDDVLVIRAILEKVSGMRIRHQYEVYKKSSTGSLDLIATGHSVLGCVNAQGELIPVPGFVRALLKEDPHSSADPQSSHGAPDAAV